MCCYARGYVQLAVRPKWLQITVVAGFGIIGFRDPYGIRPLVLGERESTAVPGGKDYMFSSESVALDQLEFSNHITVAPG